MEALIKDFKEELERIDCPNLERAFLKWFIKTKFGDVTYEITDGKHDGGIDAIIKVNDTTFVIQSKFNQAIFNNRTPPALSVSIYSEFDKLPKTFKDDDLLEVYLKTVTTSLHSQYKEIAKAIKNQKSVIWYLITLCGRSLAGERRLHNLDVANFQYYTQILRLFDISQEGGTPPPIKPLNLTFTESLTAYDSNTKITTYVLQAKIRDFIDYLEEDKDFRLLARNVRTDLGSTINDDIKNTYLNNPEEFWYSHNGITIICENAIARGKTMRIDEPSVINGAQTLHALKDAKRLDALVLVRVIVIPSESKVNKNLINSIIFRTNQQNQMFTFDLRANDKIQVKLAKEFSEKGVFYERRRKEWELNKRHYHNQKFDYLSSKKLAQILMTCKYKFGNISGVAIARKDIQYLFEDEVYFNLFNVPFREIYFKYALYKFIIATFKKIRRSLKRRQKNSTLWTCLAITWNSINKSGHLNNWCKKLEEKPTKLDPYLDDCKKLKIIIKNIFDIYWGVWEKEHRKNRDLSLHDFFKSTSVNLKIVKQLSEKFYKKFEKSLDEALQ